MSRPRFSHRTALLAVVAGLIAGPQAQASSLPTPRERAVLGPTAPLLVAPARIASNYGVVTSGFRTVAHNRAVGGMPNSYHLIGRAIDVARRPGVTHRMVDAALRRAGYLLVESIDEGDHSHFAFASFAPVAVPAPTVTVASAPAPAKPALPRLLADDHGTLLIDDAGKAPDTPRPPAGVIGVQASR